MRLRGGLVALLAIAPLGAQTPPRVSFEVASVKPNDGTTPGQGIRIQPGGRFTVTNMPVRTLVTFAYQLQAHQLVGGPSWMTNDRFDIVAQLAGDVAPPATPGQPDRAMLAMRTLLEERFQLVMHRETRQLDIYAMTMVKPGQPGPMLKPAASDCSPEAMTARRAAPPDTQKPFFCGLRLMGPGQFALSGMPLSFYATTLANQVGRFVIDRTGLEGRWDFELTAAPAPPGGQLVEAPADPDGRPHLFTALREQLGIKLDATRGEVEVVVIDRIEKPTAD
jgi:uncharacterized protein (TIGR03435 family)